MRFSTALVLAALSAGEALAGTIRHSHFHQKKEVAEVKTITKRTPATAVSDVHAKLLKKIGVASAGINAFGIAAAETLSSPVWVGEDGKYTNTFRNNHTEPIIVVVWGPWASWVNVKVPLLTLSLEPNETETISMKSGFSGGWAGVYNDTNLIDGQVNNTWGEITTGPWGAYDVSREPNMKGRGMSIKGPRCVSDMKRCVFVCKNADRCTHDYDLLNCEPGSQAETQYGIHEGAPSGGCGGMGAGVKLETTLW